MGDVNGNYATVVPNNIYRNGDRIVFDLTKAVNVGGYVDVPVHVIASESVNALDFSLQINESKMAYSEMLNTNSSVEALAHFNGNDRSLRFTSYSLSNYDLSGPVVMVRFASQAISLVAEDLRNVAGYINGEPAGVEVVGSRLSNEGALVSVFPNPASSSLNLVVSETASYEMFDVNGRLVSAQSLVNANEKHEINISGLAKGVYTLKVHNTGSVSVTKVVIE
jgi:hypothetical protein